MNRFQHTERFSFGEMSLKKYLYLLIWCVDLGRPVIHDYIKGLRLSPCRWHDVIHSLDMHTVIPVDMNIQCSVTPENDS